MKPQDALKKTTEMARQMKAMKRRAVFVGLPKEEVGGKVYGDGMKIMRVGAIHEFGVPSQGIPQRSFLRVPFRVKRAELNKAIAKQFEAVAAGMNPEIGLGRIGVIAANVSKGAFTSLGYGDWEPIQDETARRKGSSQTLIDNGVLRGNITWVVRDAS